MTIENKTLLVKDLGVTADRFELEHISLRDATVELTYKCFVGDADTPVAQNSIVKAAGEVPELLAAVLSFGNSLISSDIDTRNQPEPVEEEGSEDE